MKRNIRLVATVLALILCLVPFAGCTGSQPAAESSAAAPAPAPAESAKVDEAANEPAADVAASDVTSINLWSFTEEVPGMMANFKASKYAPTYEIKTTVVATDNGAYTSALDAALAACGALMLPTSSPVRAHL